MKTANEIANKYYSDNFEIRNDLELDILRYLEFQKKRWIDEMHKELNDYLNAILCTKSISMPKADSNSIAESINQYLKK